jgi:hypothetical protein
MNKVQTNSPNVYLNNSPSCIIVSQMDTKNANPAALQCSKSIEKGNSIIEKEQ